MVRLDKERFEVVPRRQPRPEAVDDASWLLRGQRNGVTRNLQDRLDLPGLHDDIRWLEISEVSPLTT